jgi:two-component system, LytTR family, response regulator LytT
MKIVVIEDEKITADDLIENLLAVKPNYTIVKILKSISEALAFFQQQPEVDLIFSDIQLGDGLSFDIFKKVKIKVPIIFCTAYNEYALEAFKANGIDYILKPFNIAEIKKAIEKFELLTNKNEVSINKLLEYLSIKQPTANNVSILVYQKDVIIPINTYDIAIVQLNNGIIKLVAFNGTTYFTTQSLEEIEKLNLLFFFRANRQFILHRKIVKDVVQHFNRKLLVRLAIPFDEQIFISKEKTPAFLAWLTSI